MSDIAQIIYCFTFLFGMLTWIHGLWVFYSILKENQGYSDAQDMNHHKLYKALEQIEDLEECFVG